MLYAGFNTDGFEGGDNFKPRHVQADLMTARLNRKHACAGHGRTADSFHAETYCSSLGSRGNTKRPSRQFYFLFAVRRPPYGNGFNGHRFNGHVFDRDGCTHRKDHDLDHIDHVDHIDYIDYIDHIDHTDHIDL